ncbi:hypothetical protein [Cryptosporidium parvum Iowa II]|uniref:Uncharacterized protein n=2 Tax=Cryptosporidium parvum TaxID=5807 RepID=Q5CSR8_CRYPI|nr:hypothetical protein [Cryptosporidium parvum Iowa II]EAK88435.1 hypothetical protein cgd1_1590 [Cryptosporidium parvum Iowa II]QOY43469.1 Uncharacterized protein CPATCC_0037770 [Cryptosporidium parvum]WKS76059.1 hypothetical protein CPCDC_1g1590 [Cryptosporidium sp. 43IA8]WRK30551.1 Uncharacterized protein cpbgf_1001590 [Cryptosporidium parvum]|eukprot:QOY43469.1 hypothetical protein CPATCC_000259 [Cryptosporidium parvum]
MLSISPIRGNKKGVLRMPNSEVKERSKPKCSVAFCETVEFRTVYVTKQERLGQFYDLTHWDFINEDNQEHTQNLIADFAATCIPLKDSDESTGNRKIKRLFWNYNDENCCNNFTISWLNSCSNEESSFSTEMDQDSIFHHFEDSYSNEIEYDQQDVTFQEFDADFNCEEFEDSLDDDYFIESEEISISISYK